MSKHLFIIHDEGETWKITGTRIEMDDGFVVDPLLYFECGSQDFFNFVKEVVDGSNDVRFNKGITPTESDALIITPLDSLSIHKARTRTKGAHILKQHCDFTVQFDFYQFGLLNNRLIEAGYVITDENREAKYLEVINTGDNDLINLLDSYLECRDRISILNHNYENFLTFKDNVNNALDTDEVDTALLNFASLYN